MVSDAEAPLARVVCGHDAGAGALTSLLRGSEGVGCEAVCGLLIERLQDVSVCFVAFASLLIGDCDCNLYVLSVQALSLLKTTKKIIVDEDRGNLRKHVAELDEENSRLKASAAELQKTIDSSTEAVTVLRRALDERIEDYEPLKNGNDSLLAERNTLRDQVADLESVLAKVKTSAAGDISALEARVACHTSLTFMQSLPNTWRAYARRTSKIFRVSVVRAKYLESRCYHADLEAAHTLAAPKITSTSGDQGHVGRGTVGRKLRAGGSASRKPCDRM
jgi:hypothetical protein